MVIKCHQKKYMSNKNDVYYKNILKKRLNDTMRIHV